MNSHGKKCENNDSKENIQQNITAATVPVG